MSSPSQLETVSASLCPTHLQYTYSIFLSSTNIVWIVNFSGVLIIKQGMLKHISEVYFGFSVKNDGVGFDCRSNYQSRPQHVCVCVIYSNFPDTHDDAWFVSMKQSRDLWDCTDTKDKWAWMEIACNCVKCILPRSASHLCQCVIAVVGLVKNWLGKFDKFGKILYT